MENPWNKIPLADYENHMKLDSVMQLQTLNKLMIDQFEAYTVSKIMILGIAGGNGLEHISKGKFDKVYSVDINHNYLESVARKYSYLNDVLECLCIDLIDETDKLPKADMVIANLLIEYIGYECFQKVIRRIEPEYVSCVIQINPENNWISDSPYLHIFDGLDKIHHQMDEQKLKDAMIDINYLPIKSLEYLLPNEKKLVQIDFQQHIPVD